MKVIDHLQRGGQPPFSFEIIPPLRGRRRARPDERDGAISPLPPSFIDVTSHAAEVVVRRDAGRAIERRVKRKRPGTLSICALIQDR